MNATNQKASKKLKIAAAICLASILFAAVRIFLDGSMERLFRLWDGPQIYTKTMILSMLAYGLIASAYIVVTGRKPEGLISPYKIDESSKLSKPEKIRKAIALSCVGVFTLYILYLFIFIIPHA